MRKIIPFFALFTVVCIQCKTENTQDSQSTIIVEEVPNDLAKVPESWVTERVAKAKAKLSTTEAGKIVWKAMEAHGGLDNWYNNGPIGFHFNYQPLDGGVARNTYQIINPWNSTARHQDFEDRSKEYGWDGKQAWVTTKDTASFKYNTRFWSITPYFFIGQPFVLDGQGTNLESLGKRTHADKSYDAIKVTFDAGTGDAPDDYYVLYFEESTHQLGVIRYIVSYPAYFNKGEHLPEKFMTVQGLTTVNKIVLSTGYHTHWLAEDETAGEHITTITINDIAFKPDTKSAYFEVPKEATILEGL